MSLFATTVKVLPIADLRTAAELSHGSICTSWASSKEERWLGREQVLCEWAVEHLG